jgi:hypothetical protein
MTTPIKGAWLDQLDPAEQMLELHRRLVDAADQYIAAELEIRTAACPTDDALLSHR